MKASTIVGILVVLIIIAAGVGGFIFAANMPAPDYTISQEELGDLFLLIDDLQDNYPNSPRELMEVVLHISALLYGGGIRDNNQFLEVIYAQRLLFSRELLALNPFEGQYYAFLEGLAQAQDDGMTFNRGEIVEIHYLAQDYAVAHVARFWHGLGLTNWVYFLILEDDRWKIQAWFLADEYFMPVE